MFAALVVGFLQPWVFRFSADFFVPRRAKNENFSVYERAPWYAVALAVCLSLGLFSIGLIVISSELRGWPPFIALAGMLGVAIGRGFAKI